MQMKHLSLIAILVLTAACSSNKETVDKNLSKSQLYQQAWDDLNNKNYNSIVTGLKALEPRYPFGRYAEQAQLELIYTDYKNMEPEATRAATERFIRLHPQHPNIDYIYCLKGLSPFDHDRGLLTRFLLLDIIKRDPDAAHDSFNEFTQLTSRFPNSHYVPDTRARMMYLRNLLAAYEAHVSHYYLERRACIAVANRGRYMVENFQETPAVGDGLAIMVEAYRRLGLGDLASISLEILKLNYSDNASLKDGEFVTCRSEAGIRSRLAKATLGLVEDGKPPPHMEAQAARDMIKQYEDAERGVPAELRPESQDHSADDEKPESDNDEDFGHPWWSYVTLGLFG